MNPFILLIVIYAALFLSGPLIAVFHELGHAFAYLIFTKPEHIDIFIGSYDDEKNSIKFKTGKLKFFVKRSFPFVKGIGLCHSSQPEANYRKFIVILFAGPVFTLVAAGVIAIIAFSTHVNLLILICCYIFLSFSTMSLLSNLIPRPINTSNGLNLNSDGEQIRYTLQLKTALPDYNDAITHFQDKDYRKSTTCLKKVLAERPGDLKILRLLVAASGMQKKYQDVQLYITQMEEHAELSINDMIQKADMLSITNHHDEAIAIYQQVLKKDKHNALALNNVAEELIDKGAFEIAQRALDKIIKFKPNFPYLQSTLAYSKIMQGELAVGRAILEKSFASNTSNAYTYKSLGIYYLKLKDAGQAAISFNKALEMDQSIEFGRYADELKQLTMSESTVRSTN